MDWLRRASRPVTAEQTRKLIDKISNDRENLKKVAEKLKKKQLASEHDFVTCSAAPLMERGA